MNTKITKESFRSSRGEDASIWVLWETARDGVNEPWIAIADSPERKEVAKYQRWLARNSK